MIYVMNAKISIKQLSAEIIDDYLFFFDAIAFADNKDWEGCYCVFYHHDKNVKDWFSRTKNDNRDMAIQLIHENKLRGFLAYDGKAPVAWCNANEKQLFSFDKNLDRVYGGSDEQIISIVCFLVSHAYRRQGISGALLRSVINHYEHSGKKHIEAYPFKHVDRDLEHYHGPLSLYLKNGFYIDKEYDDYFAVKYNLS